MHLGHRATSRVFINLITVRPRTVGRDAWTPNPRRVVALVRKCKTVGVAQTFGRIGGALTPYFGHGTFCCRNYTLYTPPVTEPQG